MKHTAKKPTIQDLLFAPFNRANTWFADIDPVSEYERIERYQEFHKGTPRLTQINKRN